MSPLRSFNERLRHAAEGPDEGQNVPNAAVVAVDAKGTSRYNSNSEISLTMLEGNVIHSAAFGSYVPLPPAPSSATKPELGSKMVAPRKFNADTVCWMASCTKLMATVAVMQCVESGLLSLDADITNLLPELKDIDIMLKFVDDGAGGKKPLLRKSEGKITLRCASSQSTRPSFLRSISQESINPFERSRV